MKKIYTNLLVYLMMFLLTSSAALAQGTQSNVLDGVYEKKIYKEKEIIPYEHIRESDVFYSMRIWRVIDIKEKMNLPFAYPSPPLEPFIKILMDAAVNNEITVYNPVDDQFTSPMTGDEVGSIGASTDTILVTDPITLEETYEIVKQQLNYENIKKFRVKEDWVFDEEQSTFFVRIIGISPILDKYDENGNYQGELPMFWSYYPQLRPILANKEVFNPMNDAHRMSWEDIFEMRMFSSFVFKESNVYDRRIQDYATGVDGLLEGDRIKHQLFEFEHNLWSF